MRSIFFKLILSFSLTILLSGVISALVMFSFSRRSIESSRNDFLKQLYANITHSVVLMGQSAYMMQEYRGAKAFEWYISEIQSTMRTRIYLCIDDTVIPKDTTPDLNISKLAASVGASDQPTVKDTGKELIVVQRLFSPEGHSYVVVGLHQLRPPPRWGGGPGPEDGGPPPPNGRGPGFPPPPRPDDFASFFHLAPELHSLILLLIAGMVCFKLAKSFSTPLNRLRTISRQIAGGDLSARVGTCLDKSGNEISELARDFDYMAERTENLVNAQKRLLLDISHELRSPLARLNLALELAKKHFQAEFDINLGRIGKESDRLNDLIGQLLTMARSGGTAIDGTTPRVLLANLVLEVVEDVGFETRNLGKVVQIFNLEELTVRGSGEQLRQAIENIIRNGAYYTQPDSQVEVSLFSSAIGESGSRTAVLQVRDHGPGVPEDKLPHLVEPFFRVDEARDRNSGGTGLGLAIAHQVIQQHGGVLTFTNAPDQDGLIVEIHLPLFEKQSLGPDRLETET